MKTGDKVVLTENTIVVDAYGTDLLLKGTEGTLIADAEAAAKDLMLPVSLSISLIAP